MMAHFVQYRPADLIDHFATRTADALEIVLVNDDTLGITIRHLYMPLIERCPVIEAQQCARIAQFQLAAGVGIGHGFDIDGDFLQITVKPFGNRIQGLFDDQVELLVTDLHNSTIHQKYTRTRLNGLGPAFILVICEAMVERSRNQPLLDAFQKNYQPAASQNIALALIEHERRWLVSRRAPGRVFAGLWEFPGGKMDTGETSAEAAVRETREETGVIVEALTAYEPFPSDSEGRPVILHPVHCRLVSGEPKPTDPAVREVCWVSLSELKQLPMPGANERLIALLA